MTEGRRVREKNVPGPAIVFSGVIRMDGKLVISSVYRD